MGGRYKEGDFVEIIEGDFKGCEGEIMTVISDGDGSGGCFYSILLKLRSAEVVVTVDVFSVGDLMDNHIMERIFSNEHSLSYLPTYSEYASEETYAKIDKVIEL